MMKLLHFFAIIFAVGTASVGTGRRRQPGQGPPGGGGGGPPPKDGPSSSNGTTNGTGTASAPSWTLNTTVMNITSNGVDYFNVRYINETTLERVEIDLGMFTIPAGCYPCIGSYWCANYLHPPPCRSDPECDFNEEVTGCEDMFPNSSERLVMCEECHANGSDYCIVQDMCVEEEASDNCMDHLIGFDTALSALGIPTDCQVLVEVTDFAAISELEETKNLNIIIIVSCATGLVLFFLGCCVVNYCRKNPATTFDKKMFDKYDADLGEDIDSKEDEAAAPSAFNVSSTV